VALAVRAVEPLILLDDVGAQRAGLLLDLQVVRQVLDAVQRGLQRLAQAEVDERLLQAEVVVAAAFLGVGGDHEVLVRGGQLPEPDVKLVRLHHDLVHLDCVVLERPDQRVGGHRHGHLVAVVLSVARCRIFLRASAGDVDAFKFRGVF